MSTTVPSRWTVAAARSATKSHADVFLSRVVCNELVPAIDAAIERGVNEGRYFAGFSYKHDSILHEETRDKIKTRLIMELYPGFRFSWESHDGVEFKATVSWGS